MPHNPEKELPGLESEQSKMEFVDGHPICDKCLAGEHEHPMTDEVREEKRGDCKKVGTIDGKEYQCHCGHGDWCIGGKWEAWEEPGEEKE